MAKPYFKNGKMIVWKRAYTDSAKAGGRAGRVLVKLAIPSKALCRWTDDDPGSYRWHLTPVRQMKGRRIDGKCRASEAEVLGFYKLPGRDGKYRKLPNDTHVASIYEKLFFVYRVGEVVRPTAPFSKDAWDQCASGIHFFITRRAARNFLF